MKTQRKIPGSIYKPAKVNTLVIKFKNKTIHTGLKDTKAGWQMAEQLLTQLWQEYTGQGKILQKKKMRIDEAFALFMETKINNYPKTKRMYKVAYELIISGDYYLDADKIEKDVQRYIKSTNHGAVSINTFLTYLNVFVNYCIKKKLIDSINIKEDYKKRVDEKEAKIYKEEEIRQIIEYFDKKDPELSLMIQFMLETGARMVDVLTLERKQIKEQEIIWKNKKTKAPEPRPISNKAEEILAKLPERNKIFRWTYAGSSFCSKLLREAFVNLGIEQDERSFQEFRPTFRMRLAKKGIPEAYIQYLMRHNKPVTTWKYYTSFEKEFGLKYLNS